MTHRRGAASGRIARRRTPRSGTVPGAPPRRPDRVFSARAAPETADWRKKAKKSGFGAGSALGGGIPLPYISLADAIGPITTYRL